MTNTRFINCEACQTEGRVLTNDGGPDDVDHGACPTCGGARVVEIKTQPTTLIDLSPCASKSDIASETLCDRCNKPMPAYAVEDEYGEFVCQSCDQNQAEAAWERYCEDFHDGGCTRFNSLLDQQIEAMKLK